jgi:hypothetical protein
MLYVQNYLEKVYSTNYVHVNAQVVETEVISHLWHWNLPCTFMKYNLSIYISNMRCPKKKLLWRYRKSDYE